MCRRLGPARRLNILRHIIWDLDGTLFDTYPAIAWAFKAALRDLGADVPLARIEGLAQVSLGHCASRLAEEYHLNEEEIGRLFGDYYARVEPEEQPPFPGVVAVCRHICAIGGMNLIVTHRGREETVKLLAAHGVTAYFAASLTRDDGYPRKPDPAAFIALLKRFGLLPEETLAVGDRDLDILAGRAAGLRTCLFGRGGGEAIADLTIDGFEELLEQLRSDGTS